MNVNDHFRFRCWLIKLIDNGRMKVSGYVSVDVDGELEVAHDDGVLDGRPRRVHADL